MTLTITDIIGNDIDCYKQHQPFTRGKLASVQQNTIESYFVFTFTHQFVSSVQDVAPLSGAEGSWGHLRTQLREFTLNTQVSS